MPLSDGLELLFWVGASFEYPTTTAFPLLRQRARAMSVLLLRPLLLHQQHLAACCGSVASTRRLAGAPAQQPPDAPSTSASAAAPSPVELKLRRSAKVHPVMPCTMQHAAMLGPHSPASDVMNSFTSHHSSLLQSLNLTALVLHVPCSAWMSSSAMAAPSASLPSS